jgi:hypothetical protein
MCPNANKTTKRGLCRLLLIESIKLIGQSPFRRLALSDVDCQLLVQEVSPFVPDPEGILARRKIGNLEGPDSSVTAAKG